MRRIGARCFCELSPRTAWNVPVIAARLATLRGEGTVLRSAWRAFPISGPLPPPYTAPEMVACVDRRLAEAEFRPYIRAGLDCQYRNTIIRNKQVWSPRTTPGSLPCYPPG